MIPARGGSKGLLRKNVKLLNGKPLIQYTIEAARQIFPDDVICVSTDDPEIRAVAENVGLNVPFLRPAHLATDTSSTNDVLLHAVDFYENAGYQADTLVLLQPTSPFRSGDHILEALKLFDDTCEMLVSVKETKSNPYYVLREENEGGWLVKSKQGNFIRRQDCPKVYELNGAIYILHINALKSAPLQDLTKVRKYEMDEISSLDIDDWIDFSVAELLLNQKKKDQIL